MAAMGKKHPLDIFRNSSSGFDSASRERRTMLGRVVASAPRGPAAPAAPPAPAGLPPAVAATRERVLASAAIAAPPAPSPERLTLDGATRPLQPPAIPMLAERRLPGTPHVTEQRPLRAPGSPAPAAQSATKPQPAPKSAAAAPAGLPLAPRINRVLLYSAGGLVVGLTLWTVAASFRSPSLKNSAPTAAAPAGATFRVKAASWPGTPAGQSSAWSARQYLQEQGLTDVDVLAWPGKEPNSFSRFDLVVGKAGSEAALAKSLEKVKGLKNWPSAGKQSFKDAAVVTSPN
jgi:hypothetical protein